MGTSGNRDCQWASRNALKDFTEDAFTISVGSLFHNVTDRIVKAIGDGVYSIAVGGTCRRGNIAICGLDVRRWTPWGISRDHG